MTLAAPCQGAGLPGSWEDWAEPSHPSGCTWCEVAAHPASLLPLGCSPNPRLDLVPAWQPMGLEKPSPRLRAPSSGGSPMMEKNRGEAGEK